MTWFKVDDSFWSHPKTLALTPDAIALWVRAGSWSCQHLTDGLIADRVLPTFGVTHDVALELVDAGFWDVIDGGHFFHDWDEYQESSVTVKERRRKARERMAGVRANRERTAHERALEQNAKFAKSSLNPDPTRPDPSSKEEDVPKIRPDVSRLCNLLADLIEQNGSKRPTVTKAWQESARLMVDTDKRPLGEAVGLMQWAQADSFWRANIMSMPKFREKYDTVRLQRESKKPDKPKSNPDAWMNQ